MACPSSLMSEEQFHCSICQDIFTNPVSTPCGHNYCMACIGGYWDSSAVCQCPMCQKTFPIRPDLSVNTEQMKEKLVPPEERSAQPGEVTCDACSGRKLRAVKSCLVCLTSYCSVHIKPHYDVVKLTKHKLIEPVNNLKDRLCKQHDRVLELFCRSDQTCVCVLCTETDHKTHRTVPPESEWTEKKTQLGVTVAEAQQMIQDRRKKMEEIRQSVELSKSCAQKEVQDSAQVFSALVRSIERSQAELIELIEGKQRAAERWAEGLIEELQQEITELERRRTELEQLEHVEDHIHFLQSFPALCPHTQTKDWSGISVHPDVCVGAVRKAVSQLEEKLGEELQKLANTELKRIQQYAVDVTLDPNTAAPWLLLSKDGKQVRLGDREQDFPDNPERFDTVVSVLGKEGFSSGRHYWEVKVEEITNWDLGVARESVNRKGDITLNPESGYWSVILRDGNEYRACAGPAVLLHLKQKPRKVGVYVDHEGGQVSFYNAEAGSQIYTFTDTFTEKLYPFFSPCFKMGGKKATPLIISPVRHSD